MNAIYKLETIDELKNYIEISAIEKLQPLLLSEFEKLVNYKNIKQWNELVRVCEALAITGWGDNEPFEAIADKWINGSFYTALQNNFFEQKSDSNKQWSKQKETFVIDEINADKTDYGISKFASQRNKLPKSPIRFVVSGNYQTSVQPLVDSFNVLKNKLIKQTKPELYGDTFSHIGIKLNFSHHDDKSPSVRMEYFHEENEIPNDFLGTKNPGGMPAYYIRPRLEVGKLLTKDGELKIPATRHFTKAFGYLDLSEQKKIVADDFLEIIAIVSDKLKKKKIEYNTELLKQDMKEIVASW